MRKRASGTGRVAACFLAGFIAFTASSASGEIIISEVVDGTLPFGQPKFVELTNTGCDDIDMTAYSFGNYSNGGTDLGGGAAAVLTGTLAAGDSYVVAYTSEDNAADFTGVYGFPPDFFMGGGFVNGDDVLALFLGAATGDGSDATLIDVYGEIGVDGTGTAWEYTDSYSYRNASISSPNATFDAGEWFIAGPNALEAGGDDSQKLPLILEVTNPGIHNFPEPNCGPVLVINEIMQNPSAVADSAGEYFELFNPTGSPIDINGWTIADNDFDSHVIDSINGTTVVPAGGYLVLGVNADQGVNGGAPVDYAYSGMFLSNGADEVVLLDVTGGEIDRVEYDGGPLFPDPTGASMALKDPGLDNNVGENWCESPNPFGDGDNGTPGAANDCPLIVTGACCNTITFVCVDGVEQGVCTNDGEVFTADTLCADLEPPCVAPVTGACCNNATGACADGVEEGNCTGADETFTAGTLCVDLDPPCLAPVIGACCFAGFCGEGVEEGYCNDNGGTFQGDGSTCEGVDCGPATSGVTINELRIDQIGDDNEEYFELVGAPGTSLDGLWYVVIGDGADGSGSFDAAIPLAGSTIPASGYFVAAEETFTLGTADLVTSINFENSDNVTHMLVAGLLSTDDIDSDDDCIIDVTPWLNQLDSLALVETPDSGDCNYGDVSVGPDGTFVPGQVFRCPDGNGDWVIGAFDPPGETDTPGGANLCPTPVPTVSEWGLVITALITFAVGTVEYSRRKRMMMS
ncbi:MAG: lamin tail domain-containing protein [Planctomycetota bacterium]